MNLHFQKEIEFKELRQIIYNYLLARGMDVGYIDVDYCNLPSKDPKQPFIYVKKQSGNSGFELTRGDVEIILRNHFTDKNCSIEKLDFDDEWRNIKVQYKRSIRQLQLQKDKPTKQNMDIEMGR